MIFQFEAIWVTICGFFLCMQILLVQTCSSEWSLKRINRFSWLSTAGTPLIESGHPTGWREGEEDDQQQDRGRRETEETLHYFFPCPSLFLTSLPGRLWKGRTERATQNKRDKGGWAKKMKTNLWVTLCVTCSVMLLWRLLPLQPALLPVRKRNVYQRNESLNWFTMWMWDSNFQTFAGRIPRKKEQRPKSLSGPAVCSHCWHSLRNWLHTKLKSSSTSLQFLFLFLVTTFIGIFISLLELIGFYGAMLFFCSKFALLGISWSFCDDPLGPNK